MNHLLFESESMKFNEDENERQFEHYIIKIPIFYISSYIVYIEMNLYTKARLVKLRIPRFIDFLDHFHCELTDFQCYQNYLKLISMFIY